MTQEQEAIVSRLIANANESQYDLSIEEGEAIAAMRSELLNLRKIAQERASGATLAIDSSAERTLAEVRAVLWENGYTSPDSRAPGIEAEFSSVVAALCALAMDRRIVELQLSEEQKRALAAERLRRRKWEV